MQIQASKRVVKCVLMHNNSVCIVHGYCTLNVNNIKIEVGPDSRQ